MLRLRSLVAAASAATKPHGGRWWAAHRGQGLHRIAITLAAACLVLASPSARAQAVGLSSLFAPADGAGLGVAVRTQRSPYEGVGTVFDVLPLYLYEGERVFLGPTRVGLKLVETPAHRFAVFLEQRLEGFPADDPPASLDGMGSRTETLDIGISYRHAFPRGTLQAELLHDATSESDGTEVRLGYYVDRARGRLLLRPGVTLSLRDGNLNDYYYGVRPEEANATRPAYRAGAGLDIWAGVHASYRVVDNWRLLGSVGLLLADSEVTDSPVVKDGVEPTAMLGVVYDVAREQLPSHADWPFYLKVLYGQSSACNLMQIVVLVCTDIDGEDRTDVAAVEIGIPFIERVNGWPLAFVGYVGVLRHLERGQQSDFWQLNGYMKAFFYGFPWSDRIRTRIGLGVGLSLAERVPYAELRDQTADDRSSELLNYLDPTIDINIGDLLRPRRELYLGLGVSHRSGLFGTAQSLGNSSGGSNYIYTYLEARL